MKRAVCALAVAIAILSAREADAGAIRDLAQNGVASLGAVPATSLVVAAPLVSDQAAPKGDELALRVAQAIAASIGSTAHAHAQTATLGAARAIAGKAGALLYVQVELARGELRATLDTYPARTNAWERVRNPSPAAMAHAFASARIDAEVRSFLAPILLEQARVHKARLDEPDVLALACGDVDGDGGMELVVVSRARVSLGRVQAGRFVAASTTPWADLLSRAPTPPREPLGTAVITKEGAIYVGSSDRGGVAVSPSLAMSSTLGALLPVAIDDGVACTSLDAAASAFATPPSDCAVPPSRGAQVDALAARYDAFGAARIIARDGTSTRVVAAREPNGKLRAKIGGGPTRTFDAVGAQLAVADFDQDGIAEIATTLDSNGDDAITVASYGPNEPRLRLRIPAPTGVRALAACPPEANGAPALAAVVGAEVWIIR